MKRMGRGYFRVLALAVALSSLCQGALSSSVRGLLRGTMRSKLSLSSSLQSTAPSSSRQRDAAVISRTKMGPLVSPTHARSTTIGRLRGGVSAHPAAHTAVDKEEEIDEEIGAFDIVFYHKPSQTKTSSPGALQHGTQGIVVEKAADANATHLAHLYKNDSNKIMGADRLKRRWRVQFMGAKEPIDVPESHLRVKARDIARGCRVGIYPFLPEDSFKGDPSHLTDGDPNTSFNVRPQSSLEFPLKQLSFIVDLGTRVWLQMVKIQWVPKAYSKRFLLQISDSTREGGWRNLTSPCESCHRRDDGTMKGNSGWSQHTVVNVQNPACSAMDWSLIRNDCGTTGMLDDRSSSVPSATTGRYIRVLCLLQDRNGSSEGLEGSKSGSKGSSDIISEAQLSSSRNMGIGIKSIAAYGSPPEPGNDTRAVPPAAGDAASASAATGAGTALVEESSPPLFKIGDPVEIFGLKVRSELNGMEATITRYSQETGRYSVAMEDRQVAVVSSRTRNDRVALRPRNIRLLMIEREQQSHAALSPPSSPSSQARPPPNHSSAGGHSRIGSSSVAADGAARERRRSSSKKRPSSSSSRGKTTTLTRTKSSPPTTKITGSSSSNRSRSARPMSSSPGMADWKQRRRAAQDSASVGVSPDASPPPPSTTTSSSSTALSSAGSMLALGNMVKVWGMEHLHGLSGRIVAVLSHIGHVLVDMGGEVGLVKVKPQNLEVQKDAAQQRRGRDERRRWTGEGGAAATPARASSPHTSPSSSSSSSSSSWGLATIDRGRWRPGDLALISGIRSHPELNGKEAVIDYFNRSDGRYTVIVRDEYDRSITDNNAASGSSRMAPKRDLAVRIALRSEYLLRAEQPAIDQRSFTLTQHNTTQHMMNLFDGQQQGTAVGSDERVPMEEEEEEEGEVEGGGASTTKGREGKRLGKLDEGEEEEEEDAISLSQLLKEFNITSVADLLNFPDEEEEQEEQEERNKDEDKGAGEAKEQSKKKKEKENGSLGSFFHSHAKEGEEGGEQGSKEGAAIMRLFSSLHGKSGQVGADMEKGGSSARSSVTTQQQQQQQQQQQHDGIKDPAVAAARAYSYGKATRQEGEDEAEDDERTPTRKMNSLIHDHYSLPLRSATNEEKSSGRKGAEMLASERDHDVVIVNDTELKIGELVEIISHPVLTGSQGHVVGISSNNRMSRSGSRSRSFAPRRNPTPPRSENDAMVTLQIGEGEEFQVELDPKYLRRVDFDVLAVNGKGKEEDTGEGTEAAIEDGNNDTENDGDYGEDDAEEAQEVGEGGEDDTNVSACDGDDEATMDDEAQRFQPGDAVEAVDLKNRVELNGQWGRLVDFRPEKGRWVVDLGAFGYHALLPSNIRHIPQDHGENDGGVAREGETREHAPHQRDDDGDKTSLPYSSIPSPPLMKFRAHDVAHGLTSVKASSVEEGGGAEGKEASETFLATHVTDGKAATRWSSDFGDNQWIMVDLGGEVAIEGVCVLWEMAFARSYTVQVASSSSPPSDSTMMDWSTIGRGGGRPGWAVHPAPPSTVARFVRINCLERATPYGFSMHLFQVFGTRLEGQGEEEIQQLEEDSQRLGSEQQEDALRTEGHEKIEYFPGDPVEIHGLKKDSHLNNLVGVVYRRSKTLNRYMVRLESSNDMVPSTIGKELDGSNPPSSIAEASFSSSSAAASPPSSCSSPRLSPPRQASPFTSLEATRMIAFKAENLRPRSSVMYRSEDWHRKMEQKRMIMQDYGQKLHNISVGDLVRVKDLEINASFNGCVGRVHHYARRDRRFRVDDLQDPMGGDQGSVYIKPENLEKVPGHAPMRRYIQCEGIDIPAYDKAAAHGGRRHHHAQQQMHSGAEDGLSEQRPRETCERRYAIEKGWENFALGQRVTTSTDENQNYAGAFAVDGDGWTRWGSKHSDNQWIMVDFGPIQRQIEAISLCWETAYAKDYAIDCSEDLQVWRNCVRVEDRRHDGWADHILPPYGFSLHHIALFGPRNSSSSSSSSHHEERNGGGGVMTAAEVAAAELLERSVQTMSTSASSTTTTAPRAISAGVEEFGVPVTAEDATDEVDDDDDESDSENENDADDNDGEDLLLRRLLLSSSSHQPRERLLDQPDGEEEQDDDDDEEEEEELDIIDDDNSDSNKGGDVEYMDLEEEGEEDVGSVSSPSEDIMGSEVVLQGLVFRHDLNGVKGRIRGIDRRFQRRLVVDLGGRGRGGRRGTGVVSVQSANIRRVAVEQIKQRLRSIRALNIPSSGSIVSLAAIVHDPQYYSRENTTVACLHDTEDLNGLEGVVIDVNLKLGRLLVDIPDYGQVYVQAKNVIVIKK
eukprot:jgi/Bigna1/68012/fgenesh1_pg.5_\